MEESYVLFDENTIQKRVAELAKELYKIYQDEEVIFVCTLKGAVFFCCDLMKRYPGNAIMEFLRISSYQGQESKGEVTLNFSISEENVKNKNILIIEDIVDKGYSLEFLYEYLSSMHPKTLRSCALLNKSTKREVEIEADYYGVVIEDLFVIGYGLDLDQKYRNLPYIKVLKK